MTGMGVVRLGTEPRARSKSPLGWQVEQRGYPDEDGVTVWGPETRHALWYGGPEETRKALTTRRKAPHYRMVRLDNGGIEFDTCPRSAGLAGYRTRVWWEANVELERAA